MRMPCQPGRITPRFSLITVRRLPAYHVSLTTNPCKPPVPINVQASDGDYTNRIRITWSGTSDATSYKVTRAGSADGSKTLLDIVASTYFYDYSAMPGKTYYYWIKACNSGECSDHSAYDKGHRAFIPPANLAASDGIYTNKVRVTWSAALGATRYKVIRANSATGSKTRLATVGSSYYNDLSAIPGKTYYYWVKACNTIRCSDYGDYDKGYRAFIPPANVWASNGVYSSKVYVDWDSTLGATKYKVLRATSVGGSKTRIANVTTTYFNDKTVKIGKKYFYWIKACNTVRCSGYSAYDAGWSGVLSSQPGPVEQPDENRLYFPFILRTP